MMLFDIPSQGDFVCQDHLTSVSCQPWCLCQRCEEWLGRLSLSLTSGSNNTRKVQELFELVASGWSLCKLCKGITLWVFCCPESWTVNSVWCHSLTRFQKCLVPKYNENCQRSKYWAFERNGVFSQMRMWHAYVPQNMYKSEWPRTALCMIYSSWRDITHWEVTEPCMLGHANQVLSSWYLQCPRIQSPRHCRSHPCCQNSKLHPVLLFLVFSPSVMPCKKRAVCGRNTFRK